MRSSRDVRSEDADKETIRFRRGRNAPGGQFCSRNPIADARLNPEILQGVMRALVTVSGGGVGAVAPRSTKAEGEPRQRRSPSGFSPAC